jgi:hypothetical protein
MLKNGQQCSLRRSEHCSCGHGHGVFVREAHCSHRPRFPRRRRPAREAQDLRSGFRHARMPCLHSPALPARLPGAAPLLVPSSFARFHVQSYVTVICILCQCFPTCKPSPQARSVAFWIGTCHSFKVFKALVK